MDIGFTDIFSNVGAVPYTVWIAVWIFATEVIVFATASAGSLGISIAYSLLSVVAMTKATLSVPLAIVKLSMPVANGCPFCAFFSKLPVMTVSSAVSSPPPLLLLPPLMIEPSPFWSQPIIDKPINNTKHIL